MRNFAVRTVVSLFLIAVVSVVIFLVPEWLFCLVISALIGLALFEFFRMVEYRNIFVYKYFGTIVGSLIPIVIFLGKGVPDLRDLEPMLIVVASLFALTLQFLRKDNARDHLVSMALTLFALLYIAWFFSFFIKLRILPDGAGLVAFVVFVTKSADIGAYAFGSFIGRTELIPRISPKKTKEGTVCGIITSMAVALLLGRFFTHYSAVHLLAIGFGMATIGQVGDLAESLIKRDCGIKDSGKCLAGIGGIMDLIDSLLFTAPVFYYYVTMVK